MGGRNRKGPASSCDMSLEDRLYPLLGVYERLPEGFRRAIGRVYRAMPEGLRLGAAYQNFRQLVHLADDWTPSETEEYQLRQLRKILQNAAAYCPFYQRK